MQPNRALLIPRAGGRWDVTPLVVTLNTGATCSSSYAVFTGRFTPTAANHNFKPSQNLLNTHVAIERSTTTSQYYSSLKEGISFNN